MGDLLVVHALASRSVIPLKVQIIILHHAMNPLGI